MIKSMTGYGKANLEKNERRYQIEIKSNLNKKFEIPYTTMNIGKVEGGKSINIVPNSCTTYIDFRVINEEHRIKIFEMINNLQGKYKFEYKIKSCSELCMISIVRIDLV